MFICVTPSFKAINPGILLLRTFRDYLSDIISQNHFDYTAIMTSLFYYKKHLLQKTAKIAG